MARLSWALVIFGAFVAVVMIVAAVAGFFTEKQQLHLLNKLFWYGFIAAPLLGVFAYSVHQYRQSHHWVSFIRPAMVVVLYGGFWSWAGYFGDHGAFFIWPVIVAAALLGLWLLLLIVEDRLQKEFAEEMIKLPDPPSTSGAANPDDFKDWS